MINPENKSDLAIELVYAHSNEQIFHKNLQLPLGSTVADAITASGLSSHYPALAQPLSVGIWGETVKLTQRLAAGDRVEIYRPLCVDPMQARRLRAKAQQGG